MRLTIFTDGGCRDNSAINPGPASSAFVAYDIGGRYFASKNESFIGTNNAAEYRGVLLAVKCLPDMAQSWASITNIDFKADSTLLVNQMNGIWRLKDTTLVGLRDEILEGLENSSCAWTFTLLGIPGVCKPRDQNKEADYLCNLALDGTLITDMFAPLKIKHNVTGISAGQLFRAGRLTEPRSLRVDAEGYALCGGCRNKVSRCTCPMLEEAA